MKTVQKLNGWVRVEDYSFVKQISDKVFEVVRLVDFDDYIYVEFYDKVDVASITKENFSAYGGYEEFVEQETDTEKAICAATYALQADDSMTCADTEEVKVVLVDEQIIDENEEFELMV